MVLFLVRCFAVAVLLTLLTPELRAQLGTPTEKESAEFAGKVEATVKEGNPQFLDKNMDVVGMFGRATRGLGLDADMMEQLGGKMSAAMRLGEKICDSLKNTGSYRLLRVHEFRGRSCALFRLVGEEGGAVYHELELAKNASGQVIVADIYIHNTGEWLTETYRRVFLPLAGDAKGAQDKLAGKDKDFVENLFNIQAITLMMKGGKFAEAFKTWMELPASLKADKNLLMLCLHIAHNLGDAEYVKAVAEFRRHFPNDPSLDLSLIDSHLAEKKYDEALADIDRVDKAVGGDPYLNVLRAGVFLEQKKLADAKSWAQKAVEREPSLVDGHSALLTISLEEKNHAETARLLRKLETEFGLTFSDLAKAEEYKHFVTSKEYADWMKSRKQK